MHQDLFTRDLIQLDWRVADREDLFRRLAERLESGGYVAPTFLRAVTQREERYPTALPTRPEAVAIPHCDAEHVLTPFIAFTRLLHPVTWHEMGNDDATHPVRLVFMLGFTRADGHVQVLQALLDRIQDPAFMEGLSSAPDEDALLALLTSDPRA